MNKLPFYQKNPILKDYSVNVTFDQILEMTMEEFDEWVLHTRKSILNAWNTHGTPVTSGSTEQEIIDGFNRLNDTDVSVFQKDNELTPNIKGTVIHNTIHVGSEVSQFFPNMMKVPMTYSSKNTGYSVYDLFANDKYKESVLNRSKRHFRRDSFFHFSRCIRPSEPEALDCKTGKEWIEKYFSLENPDYNFWIQEAEKKDDVSTGYYQVKQSDFLSIDKNELVNLVNRKYLTGTNTANIDIFNLKDNCTYLIRRFEKNQRMFPKSFTAFRIGYLSVPVNFPPATAKYLYEKYTEKLKDQDVINILDPSSGWGGRILGAMSVKNDRKIHYIGTDPNPDNVHIDGKTKYQHIADFFNSKTYRGTGLFDNNCNTYDIFQEGSEEISKHARFQKYKGKIDLVFTSPPYWGKEMYSTDAKQSCVKFGSSYESWRDGFLKPTLKMCYDWLKPGGRILWNIADILVETGYLPLEQDSNDYLKSLGMVQEDTLNMILASMPGSQRLDENGIPKCKNYVKVEGKYHKIEPIFVWRKQ